MARGEPDPREWRPGGEYPEWNESLRDRLHRRDRRAELDALAARVGLRPPPPEDDDPGDEPPPAAP